jgi:fucose permease
LPSFVSDRRRLTIVLVFALHGVTVGSFFSRIADLQAKIGLSEAELGLALVGLPAGVFTGSLFVSRIVEQRGTRMMLLVALPLFAAGPLLASLAVDTLSLFACLFLLGLGLTACNITMNVEADRVEAASGARLINRCHGMWGVGFLAASLAGTGAVAAGIPPTVHFIVILVVLTVATVAIVAPMEASPPRAHRGGARLSRFAVPTVGVLLIIGFACSGIWLEGSSRSWSVIYVRDQFSAVAWVATLTLPSIVTAQIAGRFLADDLIERHGPVRVARLLSGISLVGLILVVTAGSIVVALAGFALIGFGISTVQPQALSAAARLGDRPSSENVAALASLQTMIGFIAPPLFGLVASRFGIQLSFAIILPLPVLAIFFARYLGREG